MKTAGISILLFNVTCPHCGAGVENARRGYSYDFEPSDYQSDEHVTCSVCDRKFKLPKVVYKHDTSRV